MKTTTFTRTRLATCLSLVMGAVAAYPALAQQAGTAEQQKANDETNFEVIQVSGIRESLTKSMLAKKAASGVVDAISAEDIGKFPDTNLAESLQRITGVAVSYTHLTLPTIYSV